MPASWCSRATQPIPEPSLAIGHGYSRIVRPHCGPTIIPTSSVPCCARSSAGSAARLLPWDVGVADNLLPARDLGSDHGSHLAGRAGADLIAHSFQLALDFRRL